MDLDIVEAFEAAGMPPAQAMKTAGPFNKSNDNRMGRVEDDLREIKSEVKEIKSDVKRHDVRFELHTWMLGFIFAGIAAIIIKAFFH